MQQSKNNKKTRLRIAIFHLGFFFSGGGERLVIEEAKGLSGKGHLVDVYVPVVDEKRCFPELINSIRIKSLFPTVPFYYPFRDFISIVSGLLLAPLLFWRFRHYDVFLGANQPGPLISWMLSKILRKPYVVYLAQPTRIIYPRKIDQQVGFGKGSFNMFFFVAKVFRAFIKFIDRISIVNAHTVLANGHHVVKLLKQTYNVKPINCPAGCNPSQSVKNRFTGFIKINDTKIKLPYLLITNRHFPQKKFEYIISALPFIRNKCFDTQLIITGAPTNYTTCLKSLVSQLDLKHCVHFLGLVPEKTLSRIYRKSAVYVYTAPEEDFGMGVIESMAHGVPVVAWNNGGPATTVKHTVNGMLAKPFDLSDLTRCIVMLLEDLNLNRKMAVNARRNASDYSYEKHIATLEYHLLLAHKSG